MLTSEVARAANLTMQTVDRYTRRGHLDAFVRVPARGPGSRRRFNPLAVRACLAMHAFPIQGGLGRSGIRDAIAAAIERMPSAGAVFVWCDAADRVRATPFASPLMALHVAFDYEICGTVLCLDRLEQLAEENRP